MKFTKTLLFISLGLVILANLLFFLILKPELHFLFENRASSWFSHLVDFLYPRFKTESHRFNPEFFFDKANQVILRFNIISFLMFVFHFIFSKSGKLNKQWESYWNDKMNPNITTIITIIFYLGMVGYSLDWYGYLNDYFELKEFYKPVLIYKIIGIPFPNQTAINIIFFIFWGACALAVLHIKPLINSILASLSFVGILGFLQSFEKINHGYATFGFAVLIVPFLIFEKTKVKSTLHKWQNNWPLKLIQISIGLSYFLSGLEKILISGFEWTSGKTFSGYMAISTGGIFRQFLLDHSFLIILFANCVLFFQLSFWIIIFKRKLRWIYLVLGVFFHWGTILALGVGTWNSPWIFVYIFFLPLNEVITKVERLLKKPKRI